MRFFWLGLGRGIISRIERINRIFVLGRFLYFVLG